jgi:hypothetical protein
MEEVSNFHIPDCDQFNLGCALYKEKEQRGFIYFEAANTIAENWGNAEGMVVGISRIIRGWNRFYANFDHDDVAGCIKRNLGLLAEYRHRDISSLRKEEADVIKLLFREFTDALKRKSDKRKSPVSTAKALSSLAPNYFPLWDSTIAWKYDCMYFSDSGEGQYLKFAWKMKTFFDAISPCVDSGDKKNLLKKIDEYNYAKYTMGWL